jgi:hypothetical protein
MVQVSKNVYAPREQAHSFKLKGDVLPVGYVAYRRGAIKAGDMFHTAYGGTA